ncbi:MAG: hypothetical protein Q9223_002339 [Gallowayella weberi]
MILQSHWDPLKSAATHEEKHQQAMYGEAPKAKIMNHGKDKSKSRGQDDDDEASQASSPSHTSSPLLSTPGSVTSTVPDGRRASEASTHIIQQPTPLERLTSEPKGLAPSSRFGLSQRPRSRSADRRNDPLGLSILHEPKTPPSCDLIFVHGLGGTSRSTWAKGRDLDYCWPQKWLPLEPGIGEARILSFGYNANFAAAGPAPITGIAHFASDLLYAMKYAKNEDLEELELGRIVVEKGSATMGYPNEISKSLNADHHTVCKFDDSESSDYISVRNALKTLVTEISTTGVGPIKALTHAQEWAEQMQYLLGPHENHQDDFEFFRKRWTIGTCDWILSHVSFREWATDEDGSPTMLWLHALPGSGKSILSSFIIKHLLGQSFCVYYFFRFGDQSKRSLSNCLKSAVYQIAEMIPNFRLALMDISSTSKTMEKADPKTIWDKIFVGVLFKLRLPTTIYWIIDGVDESDHPQLLVEMMQGVANSAASIKILLVSRQNDDLISTFDRLSVVVPSVFLPFEDIKRDIRTCVEKEVQFMRAPQDFKSMVIERLVAFANGNFLWASLALVEVMRCNTREDLDQTLEAIPSGMEQLYRRMESNVISKTKDRMQDRKLGHTILTWATCSRRPLTLGELTQALQPEFSVILDLQFTISRVCGQFVIVDASDRLVMVHQTARDHIMTTDSVLAVSATEGHEKLLTKCLSVLERQLHLRSSDRHSEDQEFVRYAVTSWAYHFNLTSVENEEPLLQLAKFLDGNAVFAWIVSLAQLSQLNVLVYSSKIMTLYVRRKRSRYGSTNPLLRRLQELDMVESWAADFLKILGKFGSALTANPFTTYQQIPPSCPRTSMIYRLFERQSPSPPPLQVGGLTQDVWDDSPVKISLGRNTQTVFVVCSVSQFAVVTGTGEIQLYDAITFEPRRNLSHKERICAIGFSSCSNLLATYGFRTTKVWSVKTGHILHQIRNPLGSRAFTITFAAENTKLVIGSNDRLMRIAKLATTNPDWSALHAGLLKEDTTIDGRVHNVPWRMAFNSGASCVAVAYRGSPLSVWRLDPPELIRRCMRRQDYAGNAWTVVDQVIWHPQSDEQELQAYGSILASSPEGKFFAIGDSKGTIKLYNFQHFVLIYQLSCENLINDICFSPDSKRLYDIRGQFYNIWEPNALIRADESVEYESDIVSEVASNRTAVVFEVVAEVRDQLTAIGVQFSGRHQALGNESGTVIVKRVHIDTSRRGSTATPIFEIKLHVSPEGIKQILLDKEADKLLVKNGPTVTVWPSKQNTSCEDDGISVISPDTTWIKHPRDSELLLAFSPSHARIYRRGDLSEISVLEMQEPCFRTNTPTSPRTRQSRNTDQSVKIGSISTNA